MLPRRRQPSPTGKVDRAQPGPDEGKQPKSEKQATLNGSVFPFNVDCLVIGVRPLIRHALRRATFPVGEGDLRRGIPYLPLGEGAAAAAEEGRYQVGSYTAPHPSRLRRATLSQERVGGPGPQERVGGQLT